MKNNLSTEEQLFLDLFLSNGLKPSKKIECYRLAFEDEVKNISDSSCETYAKRTLAKTESKAYLNERKVSNTQAATQYLKHIKYLENMLNTRELKVLEEVKIITEIRQQLEGLSKLIQIVKPSAGTEDEYYISDLCFTVDLGELQDIEELEELQDILSALGRNGSFIAIKGGRINQMSFSSKSGDQIRQGIMNNKFKVAVEIEE